MKSFLIFILLLLLVTSCYNSNRDCLKFKTGSFTSSININDVNYYSTFSRTEDLQIEIFDGKVDSSTVRWINDCEVIFHTINPKKMADKKDIHLKILTTTDSSYTFEYSYVGESTKQKGVAVKAN